MTGVRHLLVRMSVHDQIDPRHRARHLRRHILARQPRRDRVVARGLAESGVHDDDDDVGVLAAGRVDLGANGGHDRADGQPAGEVVLVPRVRAGRGRADERDARAAALDDRASGKGRGPARGIRVGGEEGKARALRRRVQERKPVVELVIPDRRRVVVHRVHRGEHRMHREALPARGDVGERRALEHVAGVDEHHAFRARPRGASRRSSRRGQVRAPCRDGWRSSPTPRGGRARPSSPQRAASARAARAPCLRPPRGFRAGAK